MTMPKLLISAAMLLAAAISMPALTSSAARADTAAKGRQVKFVYHTMDSAERIYAHLRHTAAEACAEHGSRSLVQSRLEQNCADDLLERVVRRIGRTDLAEAHAEWIERRAAAAISTSDFTLARN